MAMIPAITIHYPIRPATRSLATGEVADLFGLSHNEPPHVVCDNLELDIQPGDLVLFTGPSGSGKSSIMREAGKHLNAIDAMTMTLPEKPLIDGLTGKVSERLEILSSSGLSEARLMLRQPSELSDGQRYRFRLAFALSQNPKAILLDEFTAALDRTLAKVISLNLRKRVSLKKSIVLVATTHEDIVDDLNPDLWVQCHGGGDIEVERRTVKKNRSASTRRFGSRKVPSPIGRTSLNGTTAATI